MREIMVVGRPNSGKTMFVLSFAQFLGLKTVNITLRDYNDVLTCEHYSINDAKRELCSSLAHSTRTIQSISLQMVTGKTPIDFILNDSCGLAEQIHPDTSIRQGMAQTLKTMQSTDYIFHIIDLLYWPKLSTVNGSIDQELYRYGLSRNAYTILANKIDLPVAREQLSNLSANFPQTKVIPISALLGTGFKEVKACVARSI